MCITRKLVTYAVAILTTCTTVTTVNGFSTACSAFGVARRTAFGANHLGPRCIPGSIMASQSDDVDGDDVDGGKTSSGDDKIQMVSPDEDLEPIPFTDGSGNVIECYSDATATIRGVEYTIGHVCDNAMDIVFMDEQDELVPIEVEDDIMDEVFPIALTSLEQEFPGEFTLLRTPATLTLIGDLGGNDEEGDDDQKEEEDEDEATAELLLSFEHKDKTYSLVHPLDLMLLVGTVDTKSPDQRMIISDEQAEQVMPTLMEMLGI